MPNLQCWHTAPAHGVQTLALKGPRETSLSS